MKLTHTCLLLLPAALLCSSCKESGEFAPGNAPALVRGKLAIKAPGAFAGELHRESRITPMVSALYLAPSEDVELETLFYTIYGACPLGAEDWYDQSKSYNENVDRLRAIGTEDPARAKRILAAYEAKARQGDAVAMINAGGLYSMGVGTEQDAKKAMEYFRMAARPGSPKQSTANYDIHYLQITSADFLLDSCLKEFEATYNPSDELEIGEQLYLFGKNKAHNEAEHKRVRDLLTRMTPNDKTGSCQYAMALLLRHGELGMTQNTAEALAYYQQALTGTTRNGGYPPAQLALANIYHYGKLGQPQDRTKSMQYYAEAAAERFDSGSTSTSRRARTALAMERILRGATQESINVAARGSNRKKSSLKPLETLKDCAEQGDKVAAYNYGIRKLIENKGEMTPEILALISVGGECKQANIEAAVRVYRVFHGGAKADTITPQDIELLRSNPQPAAQTLLANCYATGTGVKRDMAEAIRLYEANQDKDPAARYNLGLCHESRANTAEARAAANKLKQQATEELKAAAAK